MTRTMTCDEALALISEPPGEGLSRGDAAALEGHLSGCDDCRSQAETVRQARDLLEGIEAPPSFGERVRAATAEHLGRRLRARPFETPLGWGALAYSDGGIMLVQRYYSAPVDAIAGLGERLADFVVQEKRRDDIGLAAVHKLAAYHEGRRVSFDEPLDLSLVTPFTQSVLRATARIPYGEVRSYGWVAREIGRPKAARAVGGALHVNPVAPIVPCHRVIASDSTLGGYGGGVDVKRWLLRLEGYLSPEGGG